MPMRVIIIVLIVGALMIGAPKGVNIVKSQLNRGIRNNNPLNIRISNNAWTGKVTPSKDKAFETFSHSKYGFRAATKLIRNYQNLYGLNTLQGLSAALRQRVTTTTQITMCSSWRVASMWAPTPSSTSLMMSL